MVNYSSTYLLPKCIVWHYKTLNHHFPSTLCRIQNSLPNAKYKIKVWTPYAQFNHTLNPRIIMGTTMSRSFSDILLLTPSSISMLSVSVTPIAYRSLRTLAHDILPYRNPIIRLVEIKQVAKEDVHSSAHYMYIEDTF